LTSSGFIAVTNSDWLLTSSTASRAADEVVDVNSATKFASAP
jgi:hypothetical protein